MREKVAPNKGAEGRDNMLIIDRFEGDIAVCEEEGSVVEIPRKKLPEGCREGDCIDIRAGRCVVDEEKTAQRKKSIQERFGKLFR